MNIYTDISQIEKDDNTVVTMGTFDGIHLGHLNILNDVINKARKLNSRTFVITFNPHPRKIVSPDANIGLLTTLDEKIKIFEEVGIENLLIIKFTKSFAETAYDDFIVDTICNKIGVKHFIIGYDHKFGKGRQGDEIKLNTLAEENNFDVSTVPAVTVSQDTISSTAIRKALLSGDLDKANTFLAKNYSFIGKVVEGAGRGRMLGYPTANIQVFDEDKLIPANGVYLCKINHNNSDYFGIMNIGIRPTFENQVEVVSEVHIFDFNKMIYGETLIIEFMLRVRDEKKFESKEDLINQIDIDKKEALKLIASLVN